MQRIIMMYGLPASGKTTRAMELVRGSNGQMKRVNNDDLRSMIDAGKWSTSREKEISDIRETLIKKWLEAGYSVVIDNTNLHPKHLRIYSELAIEHGISFEVIETTDVSVSECVRRDMKRVNPVGEKVIFEMYYKYLYKENFYKAPSAALSKCVIVDIDGTLAERGARSPFDMSKVGEDSPIPSIVSLVRTLDKDYDIIFFSGRTEDGYEDTVKWIIKHIFPKKRKGDIQLHMRIVNDNRKDSIVKKELFNTYVDGKYLPVFVVDDRRQVVDMWRNELGLTCLEVADHRY